MDDKKINKQISKAASYLLEHYDELIAPDIPALAEIIKKVVKKEITTTEELDTELSKIKASKNTKTILDSKNGLKS